MWLCVHFCGSRGACNFWRIYFLGDIYTYIGAGALSAGVLFIVTGCSTMCCNCRKCECKKNKKYLEKTSEYKEIELAMVNDNNRADEDLKNLDESVLNNKDEQINRSLERDVRLTTELYNSRELQDLESLRNECCGSELFKIPDTIPDNTGNNDYAGNVNRYI